MYVSVCMYSLLFLFSPPSLSSQSSARWWFLLFFFPHLLFVVLLFINVYAMPLESSELPIAVLYNCLPLPLLLAGVWSWVSGKHLETILIVIDGIKIKINWMVCYILNHVFYFLQFGVRVFNRENIVLATTVWRLWLNIEFKQPCTGTSFTRTEQGVNITCLEQHILKMKPALLIFTNEGKKQLLWICLPKWQQ